MEQHRMEMNRRREGMDQRRVDTNQCQVNMDQLQAGMNQIQVNMEQPCGDMDQPKVNRGQFGGDMDQLQMNIGQFQATKVRPGVNKIRLRVKKNLHSADSDRLPQIALKPGSSPVGFALGGFHLERCRREVISPEATGPKAIGQESIGPEAICQEAISPDAIGLDAISLEAMGLGTISLETELPEVLFDGMRDFITANPSWDQYSLITSALACFLFQNGCSDKCVTQHYLDSLFSRN